MKHIAAITLCCWACILLSCDSNQATLSEKKIWVDMELEVKKKNDTIDYFYVGQIEPNILQELKLNKPGMFALSYIRFYRNDSIFKFEDDADEGTVYFNRRDVVKVTLLKGDPYIDSLPSTPSTTDAPTK
jgi:hypothetical protein